MYLKILKYAQKMYYKLIIWSKNVQKNKSTGKILKKNKFLCLYTVVCESIIFVPRIVQMSYLSKLSQHEV